MRSTVFISIILLLTVFFLMPFNAIGAESTDGVVLHQLIPEWVQLSPRPEPHPPDVLKGKSNHYYLFDRQVLVSEDVKRFTQVMGQVLDPDAVAKYSQLSFQFDPSYQQLIFHQMQVWRDGKKIDKLGDADIKVLNQEKELDNLIFEGKKTVSVILKDIRKNDIIDYAYTTEGFNPVFGKKYHGTFYLGWSSTIDKARVRINMVGNQPLKYKTLLSNSHPTIHKNSDTTTYEWVVEKTEPIRHEPNAPKWVVQYPQLQVSEYKNWEEVAKWADELFSSVSTDKSIDSWLTQMLNPDSSDQILDILNFVQNDIRYLGVEVRENSHKPSSPAEVLHNRFGDCKDKSLLLSILLKAIGVKATPALVSSSYGEAIKNWLPSPSAFDHVIVKINTQKGEFWVDPTRTQQSGGLDHRYISNLGRALLVAPNQTNLVKVPRNKQSNEIQVSEVFAIDALDKPVTLGVKSRYFGPIGNKKKINLRGLGLEEAKDNFFSYYSKIYNEIKPQYKIDVKSEENLPATSIIESYVLEKPWKETTNYLSLKTVADSIYTYTETAPKQIRTTPFSISHPISIHYRAEIDLPADSVVELNDTEITTENDVYSYHRNVEQKGNKVIVSHFYSSKKDHLKAEQIEKYLTDIETTQNSLTYWVTWQRPIYKSIRSRLDRLKELAHSNEK